VNDENGITVYDTHGREKLKFGEGNMKTFNLSHVSVDAHDNIIAFDGAKTWIRIFDRNGKFLARIPQNTQISHNNNVESITVDSKGNIILAQGKFIITYAQNNLISQKTFV